ncbi:MAG: glycoside hydrolase family 130 protein [Ignavibacteriaceae bacterium]|nr:glycoside hydrolase family 130 protein [Ignavibacteriaceae bacterium]
MAIHRYKNNPIIVKENVPFNVNSVFNPGVTKYRDEYLLLCRVEMPNGRSSLVLARSKDGYNFKVDALPVLTPEMHQNCYDYVKWGIEDVRITLIENKYYLTYTGYSKYMPLVILTETEDFSNFIIHGPISEPSNKNCALFPEKINGFYWKIDRPSAESRKDIWLSQSPDLLHWGKYKFLAEPFQGSWEQDKIGSSSPPIKTDEGWLMLYHGVRGFGLGSIYKIGVLLLDLNEPWKIKGRTKAPILQPEMEYERVGDVMNVVFSCGWIKEDNGDVKIYYSGADTNICLAETSIDFLLSVCK